jgi:tellurite resistance protein TerC
MGSMQLGSPLTWILFLTGVAALLALDLGIFQRRAHAVSVREAALWSVIWVTLSLLFNAFVWWRAGSEHGLDFFTAYLVEKSLSVDNLFVFIVVFGAFAVPAALQHRVLFWGILFALGLRAALIFAGVALLHRFHWVVYPMGAFLIFTAIKLVRDRHSVEGEGRLVRWLRTRAAVGPFDGSKFFTRVDGKRVATPMLMALIAVELTDVLFAVDSVPAVLAITDETFIVFTSNVCAMLGLRSLYFLLADVMQRFRHLKLGLAGVLAFVGAKMIAHSMHIHPAISLVVIVSVLGLSILASVLDRRAPPLEDQQKRQRQHQLAGG